MLPTNLGEHYFGKVRVTMTLKQAPAKALFLDYRGVSIANLIINGEQVKDEGVFRDHKVYLPHSLLQIGEEKQNIVRIINRFFDLLD